MKSSFDYLTKADKELLAELFSTDYYKALKKLFDVDRTEIGKDLLDIPADQVKLIARLQGRAEALKEIPLALENLHKKKKES